MSYARARLYLGISCVGMWTVLSLFLLGFRVPERVFSVSTLPSWSDLTQLVGATFVYAFLQGAFDLFGGYVLPKEYGRSDEALSTFMLRWFRGAALHGALLVLFGLALLNASRLGGFALALALFLALSALLVWGQVPLAKLVGGLSAAPHRAPQGALVLRAPQRHFTGGVAGPPRRSRVVLPEAWGRDPGGAAYDALVRRKEALLARGAYARGLLLALGWNTVGFALAYAAAGGAAHVAGLVSLSLWSTLWAFIGLLLLPTPSRVGVFAADRYALEAGVDRAALASALVRLERDQDDEPSRPKGVETIFHPIPATQRRLAALAASGPAPAEHWAPWHPARLALFLAWANLSLLSRAVHCNIGRPEVWVFLPSD
ncbi:hypothetical protein [Truepera radiovictrix]|uniref:Uncharacterized protein n=1 Tax=Truepera radiovictrix (strain DSM 17093 / CIP 108686 / LMG 22925 / RQ-24) TaxID=649638 RepID=D7CY38_TRURR|nr:hypothetical protein [Truepera radiovictrix]ADI13398.1 hypothetical protein Trad_0258 [Truepera radiovictrix DSM 17093]WMT58039.1 hypothetical protein RCV51_03580 [Truepera radiovictrix]